MFKAYCIMLAVSAFAVTGASWAATPDQVGSYVGSLKTKVRFTTSTVSVKSDMQLDIAADDSTTVTINGVVQLSSISIFGSADGIFIYGDPAFAGNNLALGTAHFKGTSLKGATTDLTFTSGMPSPLLSTATGKFKLKKQ